MPNRGDEVSTAIHDGEAAVNKLLSRTGYHRI